MRGEESQSSVRQLTISPLISGIIQGFVSVGRDKWRANRAQRAKEAREKEESESAKKEAGSAKEEAEMAEEVGKTF